MYFIEEGLISLLKEESDQEYILSKGDHFAEMAILVNLIN